MKLQLNDVVKSYGADVVLDRVNIQIKDNEKIALEIVRQAKAIFYDLFVQLKDEIDKNWL